MNRIRSYRNVVIRTRNEVDRVEALLVCCELFRSIKLDQIGLAVIRCGSEKSIAVLFSLSERH